MNDEVRDCSHVIVHRSSFIVLSRMIDPYRSGILLLILAAAGCGGPSKANVTLRKENQDLKQQVETLKRQHEADIASLVASSQPSTTPSGVPVSRLDRAFTAAAIKINSLTGWRGDELKVYVI